MEDSGNLRKGKRDQGRGEGTVGEWQPNFVFYNMLIKERLGQVNACLKIVS